MTRFTEVVLRFINQLVSTTFTVVTGCIIALVLTLFYCVMSALRIHIEPVAFGEMLSFAAAFAGIAYKSHRAKRETFKHPEYSAPAVPQLARPLEAAELHLPPGISDAAREVIENAPDEAQN